MVYKESPDEYRQQLGRFSVERLRRLAEIERDHFWFVGRRTLIARLIRLYVREGASFVLDAGCGTGAMVGLHEKNGWPLAPFELERYVESTLRLDREADACNLYRVEE